MDGMTTPAQRARRRTGPRAHDVAGRLSVDAQRADQLATLHFRVIRSAAATGGTHASPCHAGTNGTGPLMLTASSRVVIASMSASAIDSAASMSR